MFYKIFFISATIFVEDPDVHMYESCVYFFQIFTSGFVCLFVYRSW